MKKKTFKIKSLIKEHVINNSREYLIFSLIFITGIFLGVLFVNNMQETQQNDITGYLNESINKMKDLEGFNNIILIKTSIGKNILLAILLWFFGTTIIGIPVVFGIVLYRGFCLGYTISVCVSIMGFSKGVSFIVIALLLQNILFIPAILALSVSGFKLYKSIVKDKRRANIKLEVIRHTIFSIIMLVILIISSLIETYISTSGLKVFIKYF